MDFCRRDILTAGAAAASALHQTACGGDPPAARPEVTSAEPHHIGDLSFDFSRAAPTVPEGELTAYINRKTDVLASLADAPVHQPDVMGWHDPLSTTPPALLAEIESIAAEVRADADVFVLIGVGGSNNGARATIKALRPDLDSPEIIYLGTNLSARYLNRMLVRLDGKSVYVNTIAKNFATLEPGVGFRAVRHYLEQRYGAQEAARRIITTGSRGSRLEEFSAERGFRFVEFPLNVGGRYSVLSMVGLLPIAVAGIDLNAMLGGAAAMRNVCLSSEWTTNPAVRYAALRNILLGRGYGIEILSYSEPAFDYFAKWWVQLFAESEGKDHQGIFPSSCSFSEELHSMGQYIQQGPRQMFETFLEVERPLGSHILQPEPNDDDEFNYVSGKDFDELNRAAFGAALKAHHEGGVPCLVVRAPALNVYSLGQLFYFFEYACFVSGALLGVNPFDQPGVEAYKKNMFAALGKS
jgi:glucose-6-phosphate isomerase